MIQGEEAPMLYKITLTPFFFEKTEQLTVILRNHIIWLLIWIRLDQVDSTITSHIEHWVLITPFFPFSLKTKAFTSYFLLPLELLRWPAADCPLNRARPFICLKVFLEAFKCLHISYSTLVGIGAQFVEVERNLDQGYCWDQCCKRTSAPEEPESGKGSLAMEQSDETWVPLPELGGSYTCTNHPAES